MHKHFKDLYILKMLKHIQSFLSVPVYKEKVVHTSVGRKAYTYCPSRSGYL